MARAIYYCDECMTGFEVLSGHTAEDVPRLATCPACQNDRARLVLVKDSSTTGRRCPGTGCCGTPGSS